MRRGLVKQPGFYYIEALAFKLLCPVFYGVCVEIQTLKVNDISPARYNPRKDLQPGDPEYEKLKKSILEFDMVEPLVWNKQTGHLVGGHQRLKVLQELGVEKVDVSVVDLSPVKEKALNIALNKIQGEWDFPKLKDLLQEVDTGEFDIEMTGFDVKEIEDLMTQFHVWQPEDDLLEGEGELARRVIITFSSELDELEFWAKLGKDHAPANRVLFHWKDLNA